MRRGVSCRLLQAHAADPAALPLMIEPFYLPDDADLDQFLIQSVQWARSNLASFL